MARPAAAPTFCFSLITLLLSLHLTASVDPPAPPLSPVADAPGSPPSPAASLPPPPPPSDISSPPAPPPDASGPSPATPPTPSPSSPTPPPSGPEADAPPPSPPAPAGDESTGTVKENKSGEMSAGTKAGVAFGVIAFVVLSALGAFVYKKRKDNVERARYGSAARRDML